MRDDKLIEAMARAMWDAEPQLDEWGRAHPEARCRRMNMARAALAELREQGYAVAPPQRTLGLVVEHAGSGLGRHQRQALALDEAL